MEISDVAARVVMEYLRPSSERVRGTAIYSFIPPLFGNEIVETLCGVIYGLWIEFGIVAVGTFIGESK
ncbi:hypothetical protein BU24DRAFT_427406 [Aaosphaeria arxii CBS 175.79]|uniref:Uncharacterized protein n=1 Tax=Aaosphaeria arxii CBS 175.79 TaxID=1450172 RepID=A0A6A5XB26_9PLEO|nr:uncharacterized protein BU24DRAFT_427406 [Aaosphaeria arxii CBS 175.79]KAF2010275.1 hypothetical protein BU24DRAFT_427406 [Aaosphaeria arxii CBS 175.79]